jgi:tRNA (guanine9-N1)-methyltransferase
MSNGKAKVESKKNGNYGVPRTEIETILERIKIKEGEFEIPPCCPASPEDLQETHTFKNFEGLEFTIVELVVMELAKDARFQQMRKREMPRSFWELRRWTKNRIRGNRERDSKNRRQMIAAEAQRREYEGLSEQQILQKEDEVYRQSVGAYLKQQERVRDAYENGLPIVVECSFCEKGSLREIHSLARQLQYSIAYNKRAKHPAQLHFTSFRGELRRFAVNTMCADRWKAHLSEKSVVEIFPDAKLCMLSPDAKEPLQDVQPDTYYVIGGLVDRTIQKNSTLIYAQNHKIETKRLPVNEVLGKRVVLNVNHVIDALLHVNAGQSWEQALITVIPQRKLNKDSNGTQM